MKIAFKYNSQVKIYNKELKMGQIRGFIKNQFQLQPETYTLTYQDSENDVITIANNEDLTTLSELEQTSKLMKILINPKEVTEVIVLKEEDLLQSKTQEIVEVPVVSVPVIEKVQKIEKVQEPQVNNIRKPKCEGKKGRWNKWQGKADRSSSSRDKSNNKQQGSSSSEDKFNPEPQVQKKFDQFLGEQLGKFVEKVGPKIFKFFNKMNKKMNKMNKNHQHRGRLPFILANIFGGNPENFREFIQNHNNLGKQQLIKTYGQQQGLNENQLKEKIVTFKCKKLGEWFATAPENFKEFVEANVDLPPKVLRDMQVEKGVQLKVTQAQNEEQKQQRKQQRRSQRLAQKQERKAQKQEKKAQRKAQKQEKKQEKKAQKSERKAQKAEKKLSQNKKQDNRSTSKGDNRRSDSSAQKEAKGLILQSLIETFGTKNIKGYYKMIEQHFSEGEAAILQRWQARLDKKTSA